MGTIFRDESMTPTVGLSDGAQDAQLGVVGPRSRVRTIYVRRAWWFRPALVIYGALRSLFGVPSREEDWTDVNARKHAHPVGSQP